MLDDTLCKQTQNESIVSKRTGACCYRATVNNVDLTDSSLTVTFTDTPPPGLSAQIVVPGDRVRYNCGLCYTGGLGSSLPGLGFERNDKVLCLVVPGRETYTAAHVTVVGHEFETGAEDQKHCGQLGRMIIRPANDNAGSGGYGGPFISDNGLDPPDRVCGLVNPFFDQWLQMDVAKGTVNGTGYKHLMVFSDGANLAACRPYLFPNGENLYGHFERHFYVQDGFFPYGFRTLVGEGQVVAGAGACSVGVSVYLQNSRKIGTQSYSSSSSVSLNVGGPGSGRYEVPLASPTFGVDPDSNNIYIRSWGHGGVLQFTPSFDPSVPSLTYNQSEVTLYLDEDTDVDKTVVRSYRREGLSHTQTDAWNNRSVTVSSSESSLGYTPISFSMTILTTREKALVVEYNSSFSESDDIFSWSTIVGGGNDPTQSGADGSRSQEFKEYMAIKFDGTLLGYSGYRYNGNYTWDSGVGYSGDDICTDPGDPLPTAPDGSGGTNLFSGTIKKEGLVFIYLNINERVAVYIKSEWNHTFSVPQSSAYFSPYNQQQTHTLCIYNKGNIVEIDTLITDKTGEVLGDQIIFSDDFWVCGTDPSDTCIDNGSSGIKWSVPGMTCYETINDISETQTNSSWGAPQQLVSSVENYDIVVPGYDVRRCPVRLVNFIGVGAFITPGIPLTEMFDEYAKSDDGKLFYFAMRKMAKLDPVSPAPTNESDFHHILIDGNSIHLNGHERLERATGLTYSQSGLKFAPYLLDN